MVHSERATLCSRQLLVNYSSRITGKAKAVNLLSHKYYLIRPKITYQQLITDQHTYRKNKAQNLRTALPCQQL
jgi:hypothetical protein